MPDDRLFHKRAGHGARVNQLSHLEYRVWTQYLLSADDFGVMRQSAVTLQADNDALAAVPMRALDKALARLVDILMVLSFSHQGRPFICQPDWQAFQKVDYPRGTHNPKPPKGVLGQCDEPTQKLFELHPGGKGRKKPEQRAEPESNGSASVRGTEPEPNANILDYARAGARETAHAKANGSDERLTANGPEGRFGTSQRQPVSGSGPLAGSLPRDHLRHSFCGRVCVPESLHGDFVRQMGGDGADVRVRAFYASVDDEWSQGEKSQAPIGDTSFVFWRARWQEQFGTTAKTAKQRADDKVAATWRELTGEGA